MAISAIDEAIASAHGLTYYPAGYQHNDPIEGPITPSWFTEGGYYGNSYDSEGGGWVPFLQYTTLPQSWYPAAPPAAPAAPSGSGSSSGSSGSSGSSAQIAAVPGATAAPAVDPADEWKRLLGGYTTDDYVDLYSRTYGAGWLPDQSSVQEIGNEYRPTVENWARQSGLGRDVQGWEMGQYDFTPDAAIQPYITQDTQWDGEGGAQTSLGFKTGDYIGDQLTDVWQQRFEDSVVSPLYAGRGGPTFNMVHESGLLDYMDRTYGPQWSQNMQYNSPGSGGSVINTYLGEIDTLLPVFRPYAESDPNVAKLVEVLQSPDFRLQVQEAGHQRNLAKKAAQKQSMAAIFSILAAPLAAYSAAALAPAGTSAAGQLGANMLVSSVKSGIGSALGGGDFGQGMLQGALGSGLGGLAGGALGSLGGIGGGDFAGGLDAFGGEQWGSAASAPGFDNVGPDLGSGVGTGAGAYSTVRSPFMQQYGGAPVQSTVDFETGNVMEYNPSAEFYDPSALDSILGPAGLSSPFDINAGGDNADLGGDTTFEGNAGGDTTFEGNAGGDNADLGADPAGEKSGLSKILTIGKQLMPLLQQLLGGQDTPSDAPSQEDYGSDEEYRDGLAQYGAQLLDLQTKLQPGTPEYMEYVMAELDRVIGELLQGVDADAGDLMGQLRGKRRDELEQLQRALFVRGQLDTRSQLGEGYDPFTGLVFDGIGSDVNPHVAAYMRGVGEESKALSGMRGQTAFDALSGMLGRKSDLYGMQGAMNARKIQEMLEQMQDDEDRKRRYAGGGMGGDMWMTEFESLGDPVIEQLLMGLGGDEEESRAALASLFGLEA